MRRLIAVIALMTLAFPASAANTELDTWIECQPTFEGGPDTEQLIAVFADAVGEVQVHIVNEIGTIYLADTVTLEGAEMVGRFAPIPGLILTSTVTSDTATATSTASSDCHVEASPETSQDLSNHRADDSVDTRQEPEPLRLIPFGVYLK